jgi:D-alanine-D-alanine ligase
MTRRRIGVFAGGRSAEHEVSIASAEAILRAIDRERYEPYLIYIDAAGGWHLPGGPAAALGADESLARQLGVESIPEHSARLGVGEGALPVAAGPAAVQARSAVRALADAIDVAFLAVHGPFGEDGTLQGFLELAGIPYTGAGVLASAVAMDKVVFKDLMRGHGLPVVEPYRSFTRRAWRQAPEAVLEEIGGGIGPRAIVKPARLGSSVGMSLAHSREELPPALEEAFRWDTKVIVEMHVAGAREFECGVLGNEEPIVFEPGEIVSHHELYDYEAKYVPGLADVIPRAAVEPELADQLRELALAAYRAVDARGMARVDFLATPSEVYLSEMNTIPGFTATSMFPKQAELAGISFRELVGRLIELAEEPPG